jgi:hypothetical protein
MHENVLHEWTSTDEENDTITTGDILDDIHCTTKVGECVFHVDDVDTGTTTVDKGKHGRVPDVGGVTEMQTSVHELLDGELGCIGAVLAVFQVLWLNGELFPDLFQ